MRVIAGEAGGRRLVAPRGERTRPTADRVKEALFSSLAPRLAGASVIDLYAGSGALAIEALSRGADHATLVEKARPALDSIRDNLAATGLADRAEVVTADVTTALAGQPAGAPFSLALLDPPYAIDAATLTAVLAALARHLDPDALVVVEASRHGAPVIWPPSLRAERERGYGDTVLHTAVLA